MARIFITGSSDGLGLLAAKALIRSGHNVVLHARNAERAKQARLQAPGAEDVLIADLSNMNQTKDLAAQVNTLGAFDTVIHNAGVYESARTNASENDLPALFMVNTLAPYILTCLIQKPKRLIYLSSGMHVQGDISLSNLSPTVQGKNGRISYSDTKLHDLILSMAVARKWPDVCSNSVNPGWVPTKMGGTGAPDSLEKGYETQVWLAVSNDPAAKVSGCYFHHKKQAHYLRASNDISVQDRLLAMCEQITGVKF